MKTFLTSTAALLVLAALPAAGADATVELDPLFVTARPSGSQSLEHIAQPITVLGRDRLIRKQRNTIGETVAQELGVTASDFGAGSSRPVIRGLGGPRVQVLQGGIGTMDAATVSADHQTTIDPFQAQQVEIIRGPATLLYGSGASGGLVNVVTGRIPEYVPDFEAALETNYDSASDGKMFGLRARGGIDSIALHFDGLKRSSNDYESAEGRVRNSFVDTTDFNVGMSWFGDRGFFGVSFGRYDSRYGIPLDPDDPDEDVVIDLSQDRYDFAGRLDRPVHGLRSIDLRAGYNRYTHTEFEEGDPETEFRNNEWEGRIELNHESIGPFTGTLGVQYRNRRLVAEGDEAFLPPSRLQSVGVFLFEDTDWRDWHFEAGARFEHQNISPDALSGLPEVNHDVYSLSAGALWAFTPGYDLGLTATRAQRAPAIEELLADGPHLATGTFEEGDVNLDEETSNNLDLSLRRTEGRLTWKLNVFVNYIEDFIFLQSLDEDGDGLPDFVDDDRDPGGDLLLVAYRQSDALFYGTEAEAVYRVFDDARGVLDWRLFGDWVRARRSGGEDLPRISPARLGSGLDYSRGPWRADVDVTNVFRQSDTAPLEDATSGYTLLNLGFSYSLKSGPATTTVFARGLNLLDEDARRHTSFLKDRAPLPGRSAFVGIRAEF